MEPGAKGAAYAVDIEREQPISNGCPRPTLPAVANAAVRRIHHGQIRTQLAVECAIGVLYGGRRGDRCDLAAALAAVCHGQQLVLLHVDVPYLAWGTQSLSGQSSVSA